MSAQPHQRICIMSAPDMIQIRCVMGMGWAYNFFGLCVRVSLVDTHTHDTPKSLTTRTSARLDP